MHIKSFAVVSALAFAASAIAAEPDAERPRIYYPRQVKREFSNSTITSTDPASTPGSVTTSESSTTRRGPLGELLSDLFGANPESSSTTKENPNVTTVVVQSTVVITPTSSPPPIRGTGSAPDVTVQPTTKTAEPTRRPEPSTDKQTSTESGILIAPTGIVSSSKEQPTSSSDKDTVEPTSLVNNSTSTDAQGLPTLTTTSTSTSQSDILDPILTLINTLLPDPSSSNSTVVPTETSTPGVPTTDTTSTSETGILVLPTLTSLPETDSTTTSSPTLSSSDPVANATSTDLPVVTSLPPTSFTTDVPIVTTSSDVPVVNSTSTDVSSTSTGPTSTSSFTGTSTGTSPDTATATETSTGPATETSTGAPIVTSTSDAPVTSTGISTGTSSVPTDVPITNSTSFADPTAPVTTTSLPITSTAVDNSTVIIPTTTESSAALPTITASSSISLTSFQPVTSIRPTGTVSNTENWLPTTIVIEPTTMSFSSPTQSPTETSSKALPTDIPKLILPDDPDKPAPEGSVPIQIGFLFPLNYVFVASNTVAAAQIFKFLPRALADAGGFAADKVQVSKLVPYDTRTQWGYLTTIAKLNYPQNLVDKLQMDLWSPNSGIYNNADGIVRNLTALINPKVDIHGNINDGGVGGPTGGAVPTSGPGSNNDPFDNKNQGDQSSKQKATTAGIAMGAVGLSVMYGAAMFIVARRYKRKRQAHRRSSSVANSQDSSEMRFNGAGSPALMGGALLSRDFSNYGGAGAGAGGRDSHGSGRSGAGNSGRTANISAPVAAENSLGWN